MKIHPVLVTIPSTVVIYSLTGLFVTALDSFELCVRNFESVPITVLVVQLIKIYDRFLFNKFLTLFLFQLC